jgi:ABC-2 type transport system ATP-binding protein
MSILAENISKIYGSQKAVDEASFSIGSGEIVGLLGPNGAGKSTLMKIITCFIPPSSGTACVHGFDVLEQSMEVRKMVGYLPENNPLYNDMYVLEHLAFHAGIHSIPNKKARIEEMISLTGLGPERNKKIGQLSKGYRQRVGLAQALIHNPEVLILDEPTSGLDPNQLIEIRNLIRETGKSKTVLLSTHIMQEVEALCDRVIIIDRGRIVADDKTANLSRIAARKEVIETEFSSDISIELLQAIPGVQHVTRRSACTFSFEASPGNDIRQEVFDFAVRNKVKVLSMHKLEQGLEEVFQQLTAK